MIDLLLPTTDAAVLAQFLVVMILGGAGIFVTRRNPPVRLLVIGTSLLVLSVMGVRAVH